MIEKVAAKSGLQHAWEDGVIPDSEQDQALKWMAAGGANANDLTVWQILLRRHAQRSGPKTNIVQRQGMARNDYEDDPSLTVAKLMAIYELDPDQVNRAIGKTGVSPAIYRAAEEDRLLRPIFSSAK
jgi:hypothetical protein